MEEKKNLWTALLAFQKEVKPVGKDGNNPHYGSRYATLDAILEAVKPILTKHGLVLYQIIEPSPDTAKVKTVVAYYDGADISSTVELRPVKPDPQGMGSAITYARRYGLSAILGLATEEDDDANTASKPQPKKQFREDEI